MIEKCSYCHDTQIRVGWLHIGGTLGERHYVCHRRRCEERHQAFMQRLRDRVLRRKAVALDGAGGGC